MSTLFELSDAYLILKDQLENAKEESEKTGIELDTFYEDVFQTIQDDLKTKAVGYAKIKAELELEIAGLKKQEEEWKNKRIKKENALKQLNSNLMMAMKKTGETKFEQEGFNFSIVKNGGKAPLILKVKASELPLYYQKPEWKPDNEKLRRLAESGENKLCYIGERGERLNIK